MNKNLREFIPPNSNVNFEDLKKYIDLSITPMVGASGAIFGVMAAFAILFIIYTNPVARGHTVNLLNSISSYIQNLPMPKSE